MFNNGAGIEAFAFNGNSRSAVSVDTVVILLYDDAITSRSKLYNLAAANVSVDVINCSKVS